jgi:hypothetical protein
MPVARFIDPQAIIDFLLERRIHVVRRTARLAVLRSEYVAWDVIVPVYGPLTPTVAGDILTNAGISQDDQDQVL